MEKPEVIILCGGRGTRLNEETYSKPKPMVDVHVMPGPLENRSVNKASS